MNGVRKFGVMLTWQIYIKEKAGQENIVDFGLFFILVKHGLDNESPGARLDYSSWQMKNTLKGVTSIYESVHKIESNHIGYFESQPL